MTDPLMNLDGQPIAMPSPARVRRYCRSESIDRIRCRIAGGELERLPDVFLIVIERALDREIREIDRYASHPGYLFHPGVSNHEQ